MQVVGEAAEWATTLADVPQTKADMVLVDWELIPTDSSLAELRSACPHVVVIVLLSHLEARQQAARSAGADVFISKGEMPDRVAVHLRTAAGNIRPH
jgi:DNA-binding NarL/FixJ family response regulator